MKNSQAFPYNLVYDQFWTQYARRAIYNTITPRLAARTARFWEENRNKYAGRRGFVIGNGPSLKIADLSRLKNEVTIASNRIYLGFNETDWRPTFHTCGDRLVWAKYCKEMCDNSETLIIQSNLKPFLGDTKKLIFSWNAGPALKSRHGFSLDQKVGSYSGYTVTFMNLQIAAHLGLNPIYLIGCDHYYGSQQHTSAGFDFSGVKADSQVHHFHKDYRKEGEVVLSAPIHLMDACYSIANKVSAEHGIKIYNATRGGYLEIFERQNFDDIVAHAPSCPSEIS